MKSKQDKSDNTDKQTATAETIKADLKAQLESGVTHAVVIDPDWMGAAAALNAGVFSSEYEVVGIPADWKERAQKAWQYYLEEPIVSNTINTWRTFAIGDTIKASADDDEVREEAEKQLSLLTINRFIKDMILQLLVKGECIGYKRYGTDGKTSDKKGQHNDIVKLICVNPASVELEFAKGVMVKAVQKPEQTTGAGSLNSEDEIELPLEQLVHKKWNAPQFSARGNSMVVPAFESIELLRDYRRAQRAIAKRWTTPLRFIQVGGKFGDKVIMPTQKMLDVTRNQINKMDLKSGLVVPFYVKAETYGTEGQVLNTEDKVKEVKEDIIVALGVAKSLVTGDGPNFATASLAFQKMVVMLKEIKQVARELLDWIFDDWREMKGYSEKRLQYIFSDVDLTNQVDVKKLLIEMYDRNLISKHTMQQKMDLDPEVEKSNRSKEGTLVDMSWDIKDIVSLVQLNVLSKETAQSMLGIDDKKENEQVETEEKASSISPYAEVTQPMSVISGLEEKTCGECINYSMEEAKCLPTGEGQDFMHPACLMFDSEGEEVDQ
ncbi:MAG: hypothetical protein H8E46_12185 [FCB group bacterium]|nr:hypothetical protein [FCB group bacterium]